MSSSKDFHLISLKNALGLGGIAIAVLIPVVIRRACASPNLDDEASFPPNTPFVDLPDPLASPRAEPPPYIDSPGTIVLDANQFTAAVEPRRNQAFPLESNTTKLTRYRDRSPDQTVSDEEEDDDDDDIHRRGTGDMNKVAQMLGVQVDRN